MLGLVLPALAVSGFFIYVLLFGPTRYHRNGAIGRLHLFLTMSLPGLVRRAAVSIFGRRLVNWAAGRIHHLLFERHPLMQIFYLFLFFGGLYCFVRDGWPYLYSARYTSPVHIVTSWISIVITIYMFTMACVTDPGYISKKNVKELCKQRKFDGVIFKSDVMCRTCGIEKPARSKHCSLCGRCVDRHDHRTQREAWVE